MKIHKELWYVKRGTESLSYMTYYEDNKAFEKRQSTGLGWAGKSKGGSIITNEPLSGFKIGDCNSRWSTSNKVFEVIDPRGFKVEIPSGNLASLVGCTTIVKGEIQGVCVWAREGNNHILLSIDSEPYQEALKTIEKDKIKKEKLEKAKKNVKNFELGDTFSAKYSWKNNAIFLTRAKLVYRRFVRDGEEFIKDSKLEDVFLTLDSQDQKVITGVNDVIITEPQGKSLNIKKSEMLGLEIRSYGIPPRVKNQSSEYSGFYKQVRWFTQDISKWEIVGYQEKGSKEIVWKEGYEGTPV